VDAVVVDASGVLHYSSGLLAVAASPAMTRMFFWWLIGLVGDEYEKILTKRAPGAACVDWVLCLVPAAVAVVAAMSSRDAPSMLKQSNVETVSRQRQCARRVLKRANFINMNPTGGAPSRRAADLLIRRSRLQRAEHNITSGIHASKGRCLRPRGFLRRQEGRFLG